MLTEPLPSTLDVRKAAARGVIVSGTLKPVQLPRFQAMLASEEGHIEAELTCFRDEERQAVIELRYQASVSVVCQRCLQPMPLEMSGETSLGIVWTDDEQVAPLVKDNVIDAAFSAPALSSGTSSGGDYTSKFVDSVNGDFTPAGELLASLKPSAMPIDRKGTIRDVLEPAGSVAIGIPDE